VAQAQPAWAEDPVIVKPLDRPDPATVSLPDMSSPLTPKDARDFDDYYYFYKPGVAYERAFADFDQCRMTAAITPMFTKMPVFVPLSGDAIEAPRVSNDYGRVTLIWGPLGGVFAGALIAIAEDNNIAGTNRKCLFYKGYKRYGTTRKIFKAIETGTDGEKTARKALIAAGAVPQGEELGP
jgi:hypothetical protein